LEEGFGDKEEGFGDKEEGFGDKEETRKKGLETKPLL
jgi:hypothetical protein